MNDKFHSFVYILFEKSKNSLYNNLLIILYLFRDRVYVQFTFYAQLYRSTFIFIKWEIGVVADDIHLSSIHM